MNTADFEREFAYTQWEHCCKDPAVVDNDLRECRRPANHEGRHASGFGPALRLWGEAKPNPA